ncbi:MAG: hypothetical protein K8H88_13070 [Sandaracinaceae bacterium]|nr:hypothetical protein [Sandaracinaceae bacterium]
MAFVLVVLLLLGLGLLAVGTQVFVVGLRERRAHRDHRGDRPVTDLGHARAGSVVYVVGTLTSPDVFESPSGEPRAAHLHIDVRQVGDAGGTLHTVHREVHGNELVIDDGTGTALLHMAHADVRARDAVERIWSPREPAPAEVSSLLIQRGKTLPPPPRLPTKGTCDLCYRERALRHGDTLRVRGLVLEQRRAEPGGLPRVLLSSDRGRLGVTNLSADELDRLDATARRLLLVGAALLAGGLACVVGAIAWGRAVLPLTGA